MMLRRNDLPTQMPQGRRPFENMYVHGEIDEKHGRQCNRQDIANTLSDGQVHGTRRGVKSATRAVYLRIASTGLPTMGTFAEVPCRVNAIHMSISSSRSLIPPHRITSLRMGHHRRYRPHPLALG